MHNPFCEIITMTYNYSCTIVVLSEADRKEQAMAYKIIVEVPLPTHRMDDEYTLEEYDGVIYASKEAAERAIRKAVRLHYIKRSSYAHIEEVEDE